MSESLIVIIASVILLVGVALIFIYFFFRSIKQETDVFWNLLMQKLGVRLDKIPNLIETVKKSSVADEKILSELIDLRAKTWNVTNRKERVHAELNITSSIHSIWKMGGNASDLQRDTNYLELRMEFKEIGKEIEDMGEIYNTKIRNYNKLVGFIFLKQVLALMHFKTQPIFEFEV